jgi:high-affinity K+ transport system ATPase subunit B
LWDFDVPVPLAFAAVVVACVAPVAFVAFPVAVAAVVAVAVAELATLVPPGLIWPSKICWSSMSVICIILFFIKLNVTYLEGRCVDRCGSDDAVHSGLFDKVGDVDIEDRSATQRRNWPKAGSKAVCQEGEQIVGNCWSRRGRFAEQSFIAGNEEC